MLYKELKRSVPEDIKSDALWTLHVYRLALYAGDLAIGDARRLRGAPEMAELAGQLVRAVGSIGANIAEGYSRLGARERARFFEYALGSARESRDWYYKARFDLDDGMAAQRIALLTRIAKVVLALIAHRRRLKAARRRT
jgi:four helix bundle protein